MTEDNGAVGVAATSSAFKTKVPVGAAASARAMRMTRRSSIITMRVAGGRPTLQRGVGMVAQVGGGPREVERKKFQFIKDNPQYVNKPFTVLEFDLFANSE
jgi:hypothetical protein